MACFVFSNNDTRAHSASMVVLSKKMLLGVLPTHFFFIKGDNDKRAPSHAFFSFFMVFQQR